MSVEVYTTERCSWCKIAKRLLDQEGVTYTEIEVTKKNSKKLAQRVADLKGVKLSELQLTVPQIFWDHVLIGGYDDLVNFVKRYKAPEKQPSDIVDLPRINTGKSGYRGLTLPDIMPIVAPRLPLDNDDDD